MAADIGTARGGRKASADIHIEIVRALTEEDLPTLQNPPPVGSTAPTIQALRASHHQLAEHLASGKSETEVALITGYSLSRISILKSDPTFAELLAGYTALREKVFVDTLERMRVLGLSTLDELQERLETGAERWTNRELMEMAEMLLVKPRIATPGSPYGATPQGTISSGVHVTVQFVKSDTPPLTIEGKAEPPSGGFP